MNWRRLGLLAALSATLGPPASSQIWAIRGKVEMQNGTAPSRSVTVVRACPGFMPDTEAITNPKGEYLWRVSPSLTGFTVRGLSGLLPCVLRAVLDGYESTTIDISDPRFTRNPQLPTLVLRPRSAEAKSTATALPRAASMSWALALEAMENRRWPEAARQLRATLDLAPHLAAAWSGLGVTCQYLNQPEQALDAYRHAAAEDPKLLIPNLQLMRLATEAERWDEASRAAAALLQADVSHRYLEAFLDRAIATYHLHDVAAAQEALAEGIRLDTRNELPRLQYLMGLVHATNGDRPRAAELLRAYLAIAPAAPDAAAVTRQIDRLEKTTAALDLPTPAAVPSSLADLLPQSADAGFPAAGEAWVPGGIAALASAAGIPGTPAPDAFFLEYCRAIVTQTSLSNDSRIPAYTPLLEAYFSSLADLTRLGDLHGSTVTVTLSLATDAGLRKTARILPLLGWKVVQKDAGTHVEPGDQPADGLRQRVPRALGIDQVAMQQALDAGRNFQFEVLSENARLVGGPAWGAQVPAISLSSGGIAESFLRDPRLAKTYAGLVQLGPDRASALVTHFGGLRKLLAGDVEALWLYGGAFAFSADAVAVPGGPDAAAVWEKLAGASPGDPPRFVQAVLEGGHGRLAAFYSAVAQADPAHQRFLTRDSARMQRLYAWYRDSEELRAGIGKPAKAWRPGFLQNLPLDSAGNLRFPGGRRTWSPTAASDDDAILRLPTPEALPAVGRLEDRRGAPLDPAAASLLARHYSEWQALFPYFESLPGLGRQEFEALAALAGTVAGLHGAAQNLALGAWHSLVELIVLGSRAGSLDPAAGARAFRRASEAVAAPAFSAPALRLLREISGTRPDLDEAVAADLLKLRGPARSAFDRVRDLQRAPRLQSLGASPDPAKTVAALAGAVYGALLNPDGLLVTEEPALLAKHQFLLPSVERRRPLFAPAALYASIGDAAHFRGGFGRFEEVARTLASAASPRAAANPPVVASGPSDGGAEPAPSSDVVFHAAGRLVQISATVTDDRGRYVDDLAADQFTILDRTRPVALTGFESRSNPIACALLLDTTESMQQALPALKNAAVKLIAALRPIDTVAVYSLSGGIAELQPFTTDKAAAMRAVLQTDARGTTALYDALLRVNHDLAPHTGKKAIVVFTDGDDNASTLPAATAILRARTAGVPIYTIAQGEALDSAVLLKHLEGVARATGGLSFAIHSAGEIGGVFERVLQDLLHGYLLAFQPDPAEDRAWRPLEVVLRAPKGRKVRAREGYYPE